MKNFRAADKTHAGGDEKHDINFIGLTLVHSDPQLIRV
jgi:hypothetical protein